MEISYAPFFIRQFGAFEDDLQDEIIEKIELFKDRKNHRRLRLHKLKGQLLGRYSFSVNYRFRIIFAYISRDSAVLLAVGDHDVYKE